MKPFFFKCTVILYICNTKPHAFYQLIIFWFWYELIIGIPLSFKGMCFLSHKAGQNYAIERNCYVME